MKLFTGPTPNGARVAVFLAEKGIEIETETLDVLAGEARAPAHRARNSLGQVPVLELDDGRFLAESVAICRYLEARHPEPPLFGRAAEEAAFVEMWIRRLELLPMVAIGDVGLHSFAFFADRVEQNAAYAEARRRDFLGQLAWLDGELADGRAFVAGEDFSMADIIGVSMLMVAGFAGIAVPETLAHVRRWEAALRARPSFPAPPGAA